MKSRIILPLIFPLLIGSQSAYSTINSALAGCGKRDGNDWHWIMDASDPNHYWVVEGVWEVGSILIDGTIYQYPAFQLERSEYDQLISHCETDYAPQPSDGYSAPWALFHIMEADGGVTRAQGVFETLVEPGEQSIRFIW